MEPALEVLETGEKKSKVVNELKVDGGMEKEGGKGKKEGSVKENLACHFVPLSGGKRKVSSCIVMWLYENG